MENKIAYMNQRRKRNGKKVYKGFKEMDSKNKKNVAQYFFPHSCSSENIDGLYVF